MERQISTVALFFIYSLLLISQIDNRLHPTFPHFATWTLGLVGEVAVVAMRFAVYQEKLRDGGKRFKWSSWEIVDLSVAMARVALLLLMICLYLGLVVLPSPAHEGNSEETTGLLGAQAAGGYGATDTAAKDGAHSENESGPGWARKTTVTQQSWWEYLRGYTLFFPYLWPSKQSRLQMIMLFCFILVILQRVVNVMVPDQLGKITDILSGEKGERELS